MSELVGFDEKTAGRILQATRKVEAFPFGQPPIRENSSIGALTPHTVIFRVTNTNPTNGFWQCRWLSIEILATGSPAITLTTDGEQGWAYGLTGGSLQQDFDYFGQFVGFKPDDGRAVFATDVASVVAVKCTNATPTNFGGRFIFQGSVQNFRASTATFNNARPCAIHDMNNVETLVLNDIYLGYIGGTTTGVGGFTNGTPIVLIQDFHFTFQDVNTGTVYSRVRRLEWDSTPTEYDPTKGDIVVVSWSTATRTLRVRLNGDTGGYCPVFDCSAGSLLKKKHTYVNGLLKTVGALSSSCTEH